MIEKNQFGQNLGTSIIDWASRAYPSASVKSGLFCSVEPLDVEIHGAVLFEALCVNNDASWTYLPLNNFNSYSAFKAWLIFETAKRDQRFYAIVDKTSGSAVGMCALLRINPEHGVAEIGCINYAPSLKKTPAATEAMYLMMKEVFDELGYRRYEWKCNNLNQASKNAALRLGFVFEGIFRQHNVFKHRNRDTAWFSIIDSEWPAIKQRLQRWLSSENFDVNGQQLKKLSQI